MTEADKLRIMLKAVAMGTDIIADILKSSICQQITQLEQSQSQPALPAKSRSKRTASKAKGAKTRLKPSRPPLEL